LGFVKGFAVRELDGRAVMAEHNGDPAVLVRSGQGRLDGHARGRVREPVDGVDQFRKGGHFAGSQIPLANHLSQSLSEGPESCFPASQQGKQFLQRVIVTVRPPETVHSGTSPPMDQLPAVNRHGTRANPTACVRVLCIYLPFLSPRGWSIFLNRRHGRTGAAVGPRETAQPPTMAATGIARRAASSQRRASTSRWLVGSSRRRSY